MKYYSKGQKFFCLLKAYLDTGWSITSYLKYAVAFFGLKILSTEWAIIAGLAYLGFCFVLGFFWIKLGFKDAESDVANDFNPFQKDVRRAIKKKKFK
jgi:hypothetical protein